jgi:hypothetical protein
LKTDLNGLSFQQNRMLENKVGHCPFSQAEKAAAVTAGLLQATSARESSGRDEEADQTAQLERQRKREQLREWKVRNQSSDLHSALLVHTGICVH